MDSRGNILRFDAEVHFHNRHCESRARNIPSDRGRVVEHRDIHLLRKIEGNVRSPWSNWLTNRIHRRIELVLEEFHSESIGFLPVIFDHSILDNDENETSRMTTSKCRFFTEDEEIERSNDGMNLGDFLPDGVFSVKIFDFLLPKDLRSSQLQRTVPVQRRKEIDERSVKTFHFSKSFPNSSNSSIC